MVKSAVAWVLIIDIKALDQNPCTLVVGKPSSDCLLVCCRLPQNRYTCCIGHNATPSSLYMSCKYYNANYNCPELRHVTQNTLNLKKLL